MTNSSPTRGKGHLLGLAWFAVTLVVLGVGFQKAMTAPTEATMGNLYRVFFYHFPQALLSFVFPYVNCVACFAYLYWRNRNPPRAMIADAVAVASAEISVLFSTLTLATGMLWGRAAWGIWWTWDARLTTALLLWLLYVSYLLVREFSGTGAMLPGSGQTGIISAVLGVFAAIDVPICFMSIRWWRTQHPAPVFGGGQDSGIDPSMMPAVLWNLTAWAMWSFLIFGWRYALERRRQQIAATKALAFLSANHSPSAAAPHSIPAMTEVG